MAVNKLYSLRQTCFWLEGKNGCKNDNDWLLLGYFVLPGDSICRGCYFDLLGSNESSKK